STSGCGGGPVRNGSTVNRSQWPVQRIETGSSASHVSMLELHDPSSSCRTTSPAAWSHLSISASRSGLGSGVDGMTPKVRPKTADAHVILLGRFLDARAGASIDRHS